MELNLPQMLAVWTLPVLFAITLHEVAHGWVAYRCGDNTASDMGRLTLNPIAHIDFIGTILVPVILLMVGGFVFGWAKPVPVDWRNLHHPRRDMALVAVAGPLTNLLMALIWAGIAKLAIYLVSVFGDTLIVFVYMGKAGISINLVLMLLNLIPIPPLDGSRVVAAALPMRVAFAFNRMEPYGFFILLALIGIGALNYIMAPPYLALKNLFMQWFGLS